MAKVAGRGVAAVDFLVDENGQKIDVPDDSTLQVTDDVERTVGATGPTGWWGVGLIAIALLVVVLLVMQFAGGGAPSTEVIPGTPVAAPKPAATTTP